jgi:hypothetical protein
MAAKPKPAAKLFAHFRHELFLFSTRNHLAAAARADGFDWQEAREYAHSFKDDALVSLAESFAELHPEAPKVGAGGILAAVLAFLMSPQFAELIAWIMSLFAGTKASVAVIMAKVQAAAAGPSPATDNPPPADPAPSPLVA